MSLTASPLADNGASNTVEVVCAPSYAWHRRPGERFGPLLIVTGFGWFLTTLAESDDSFLYHPCRVTTAHPRELERIDQWRD